MSEARLETAITVARSAGALAHSYFDRAASLTIEHKGTQDLVSEADRETERHITEQLLTAFPQDGFMGEEHGLTPGSPESGTWVVDPIDGTQPFLLGLPTWCISIAYVVDANTGKFAAFGIPWNPTLAAQGRTPQQDAMRVLDVGNARSIAIQE